MDRKTLLERVSEDLFTYMLDGSVSADVLSGLLPATVPDRYRDYELLLDTHFLLTPEVQEFVSTLPNQLRGIQTETTRNQYRTRGEIDGRIDWGATIATRHAENPNDHSLFIVENREQTYDTAENIVLKQLLTDLESILERVTGRFDKPAGWIQERWDLSDNAIERFKQVVNQNVHTNRIREPKSYEPTERMLTRAAESRSKLYRDAAALIRRYQSLQDGNPDAIRRLVQETTITPDGDDRLFELYVLFEIIGSLEEVTGDATLHSVELDRNHVAHIQDDRDYYIYYDQSAGDRDLEFTAVPDTKSETDYTRAEWVTETSRKVGNHYFSDRREWRHHTKRPDVLVVAEPLHSDGTVHCLAVEVKHSTKTERLRAGIRETLEYIAYMQQDSEFVFENTDGSIATDWNGLLVTDELEDETVPLHEQAHIKILQGGEDVENNVHRVLDESLL